MHLIGWEGGAGFLDQSQSEIKLNQINCKFLFTPNWKFPQDTRLGIARETWSGGMGCI